MEVLFWVKVKGKTIKGALALFFSSVLDFFSWFCFSRVLILALLFSHWLCFFFPFLGYVFLTLLFSCCFFYIGIITFSQKCENTTTSTTWLIVNPSHVDVTPFLRWCYCLPTLMVVLFSHVGVGGAFLHWWCCFPTLALLFAYIGGVVAFLAFVLLFLLHKYYCLSCVVLLPLSHWSYCSSHVLLLLFLHFFFHVGVIVFLTLMLNAQVLIGPTLVVALLMLVLLLFPWLVWYFPPSYLV